MIIISINQTLTLFIFILPIKKPGSHPGPLAIANLQGLKNKKYASLHFQNNGSYLLLADDADLH